MLTECYYTGRRRIDSNDYIHFILNDDILGHQDILINYTDYIKTLWKSPAYYLYDIEAIAIVGIIDFYSKNKMDAATNVALYILDVYKTITHKLFNFIEETIKWMDRIGSEFVNNWSDLRNDVVKKINYYSMLI